jgi:FlaA1/EpsC-like NDP-sugar epimerase
MPLNNVANHILALPRPLKRFVVLAVDVGLCVLSVWVAFYLRLDEWVAWRTAVLWPAAVSVVFALPVFVVAGMYRDGCGSGYVAIRSGLCQCVHAVWN